MKDLFPLTYDRPPKTMAMAGLAYGFICFYTLPFLTLFFAGGFEDDVALGWFETAYHLFNFGVTVWLFKPYLKESWFNVQCNYKAFFVTVGCCAGAMLVYAAVLFWVVPLARSEDLLFASQGTLPLVEIEIFNLSGHLVSVNPIGGLLSVLVLSPVVMSCIYYASGFAPVCSNRPWLAYLAVVVVLAVPRVLSSLTFWSPHQNLTLYLAQLPLHLIACYAYQRTDTVWGPIFTHGFAGLAASAFYLFLF